MNTKILLEKVKKELKPNELILCEVDKVVNDINKEIKKHRIIAECVKGGSVAKGTFLKNDYDVDLFVRFDLKYRKQNLSELLEKILKFKKPKKVHGSRDYFQFTEKLNYEIVPVLNVSSYRQAENVTDMSPLHVEWVELHTKKNPALKDEIRLTKQFCKSAKIYGAESHIKGFSGHILDILIIYYHSFTNLLKAASKWNEKVIIDIEKQLENPLFDLNKSKTQSPLIIVDPVQKNRNAAAALSKESFNIFRKKAKEFLKKPSEEFFRIKAIDINAVKKKYKKENIIVLKISALEGKDDVVGSKLLKAFEFMKKELIKNDFKVMESGWNFNMFYFAVKKEKLSNTIARRGPPLAQKNDVENFKRAHKGKKTFIKNSSLYAVLKRKYLKPQDLIKALLRNIYIKEKAKKITWEL